MLTVKIIKKTEFETKDKQKGITYTGAYRGRVFGISTLSFEAADLRVEKDNLVITTDVEALAGGTDALGNPYPPRLVPKLGFTLASV